MVGALPVVVVAQIHVPGEGKLIVAAVVVDPCPGIHKAGGESALRAGIECIAIVEPMRNHIDYGGIAVGILCGRIVIVFHILHLIGRNYPEVFLRRFNAVNEQFHISARQTHHAARNWVDVKPGQGCQKVARLARHLHLLGRESIYRVVDIIGAAQPFHHHILEVVGCRLHHNVAHFTAA